MKVTIYGFEPQEQTKAIQFLRAVSKLRPGARAVPLSAANRAFDDLGGNAASALVVDDVPDEAWALVRLAAAGAKVDLQPVDNRKVVTL